MSDEIKTEEKECKCFCQSKAFKKFLTIALGTFVGVYCALSLFAALHRPPVMPPRPMFFNGGMNGCPCQMHRHHPRFDKPGKPDFRKFPPRDAGQKAPFDVKKPDIDD